MTALPHELPPRLTTSEVLTLARISAATFRRRRRAGVYQLSPCDRGTEDLWKRDDVLRALGMKTDDETTQQPARQVVDPEAIRAARSRQVRQRAGAEGGRDVPRPVRSAGAAPPVRLAFDASAADRG